MSDNKPCLAVRACLDCTTFGYCRRYERMMDAKPMPGRDKEYETYRKVVLAACAYVVWNDRENVEDVSVDFSEGLSRLDVLREAIDQLEKV
jgi:hypothetical protein